MNIPGGYGAKEYLSTDTDMIKGQESANMFKNNIQIGEMTRQRGAEDAARSTLADLLSQPVEPSELDKSEIMSQAKKYLMANPNAGLTEEQIYNDLMQKRMAPKQQAQTQKLHQSQVDIGSFLNPVGSGTSRSSVYSRKADIMQSEDARKWLDQAAAAEQAISEKRAENPSADVSQELASLSEAEREYRNLTQTKMPTSMTRSLLGEQTKTRAFQDANDDEAYKAAIDSVKEKSSKVKDLAAQMSKVDAQLKKVANEKNPTSAQFAVKMLVQSLDNSAVMAGEMGIATDPSIIGMIKSAKQKYIDGEYFTKEELQNLYGAAQALATGTNNYVSRLDESASDVYINRVGEGTDTERGLMAIDAYMRPFYARITPGLVFDAVGSKPSGGGGGSAISSAKF